MVSVGQTKYAYLVTVVGVALMAVTTIYGYVRAMMFRPAFRGGFNSTRQFMNPNGAGAGFGFGFSGYLGILAVIIALVGVVWLGLAMMRTLSGKKTDWTLRGRSQYG
jgi:hypothetical protein